MENSIIHGIQPDKKKRGLISVKGYQESSILVFTVTDNGKGMKKEETGDILYRNQSNQEKGRFSSIGLSNVNQRIQLLFGTEYGLTISSAEGAYTKVTIRLLPVREES